MSDSDATERDERDEITTYIMVKVGRRYYRTEIRHGTQCFVHDPEYLAAKQIPTKYNHEDDRTSLDYNEMMWRYYDGKITKLEYFEMYVAAGLGVDYVLGMDEFVRWRCRNPLYPSSLLQISMTP